jgi:dolichol-phosphate mannosyltransferase
MANEEKEFALFTSEMSKILDHLLSGTVYLVVDSVSRDMTWELCKQLAEHDSRYRPIWAPENRNVVDAYLRGFKEALDNGHEIIIEMDAGMSHDPGAIPMFLKALSEGNECAFGSRFINGGSMANSPLKRRLLSQGGTFLANILLGTKMSDMTSGFQGFHAQVLKNLLAYPLRSTAHFYQTEVRYLLRNRRYLEVPIHYQVPSPRVSSKAIRNALTVLLYYFFCRVCGRAASI